MNKIQEQMKLLAELVAKQKFCEAEDIAKEIVKEEHMPFAYYEVVSHFYMRTRRFDEASALIQKGLTIYTTEEEQHALYQLLKNASMAQIAFEKGKLNDVPQEKEGKKNFLELMQRLEIV